jgi:hypothetical protein
MKLSSKILNVAMKTKKWYNIKRLERLTLLLQYIDLSIFGLTLVVLIRQVARSSLKRLIPCTTGTRNSECAMYILMMCCLMP